MQRVVGMSDFYAKQTALAALLKECELNSSSFALEGLDKRFFSGMFSLLVKSVSGVTNYLNEFLSFDKKGGLSIEPRKFAQAIKPIPYTSVCDLNAAVPEGLKSTYLEALAAISKSVDHVPMGIRRLDEYLAYLAKVVTDHRLTSSFADDKKFVAMCATERKVCYDAIGKCFTSGSYKADQKVKDVLKKNGDWEVVIEKTNELISKMESVDREKISQKIGQCSTYLNLIMKNFEEDGDRKITQEAAKRLGDLTENIAREIEFFSLTYYRVLTMRGAIQNTTELVYNTFAG